MIEIIQLNTDPLKETNITDNDEAKNSDASMNNVDGIAVEGTVVNVEDAGANSKSSNESAEKTIDEETGIEIIDYSDVDYHAGNDGKPIVEFDGVDENGDLNFTASDDELNKIIDEKMGGFKADNRQPDPEPTPDSEPTPTVDYVPVTPGPGFVFVALSGFAGGAFAARKKLSKVASRKNCLAIYETPNYDFEDYKSFIR